MIPILTLEQIQWLGYAGFRIQGPPLIYVNPWRVTRGPFNADAILITHEHYTYFSPGDIAKLRGDETLVIGPPAVIDQLSGHGIALRPWQSLPLGDDASVRAVPAQAEIEPGAGYRGLNYIISTGFYDIFYAGELGFVPDTVCDIAILPIGHRATGGPDMALAAVEQLRPRWVVPCIYNLSGFASEPEDLQYFIQHCEGLAEPIMPHRSRW